MKENGFELMAAGNEDCLNPYSLPHGSVVITLEKERRPRFLC